MASIAKLELGKTVKFMFLGFFLVSLACCVVFSLLPFPTPHTHTQPNLLSGRGPILPICMYKVYIKINVFFISISFP